jgi:hypothetical protein
MTYFEAMEIYMDFCVSLEYKDLFQKNNVDVLRDYVSKYGVEKITEAVRVLCKKLEEDRRGYLSLLNIVQKIKLMEGK